MNYSILKPQKGYVVLKELEDESDGKILIKGGDNESRAMARVVAVYEEMTGLLVDDLVVYNEYEGQELFKYGNLITEDKLIVIKEENIILRIDEQK